MTKMKAFAVLEDCENTGAILFARHDIVAKRQGANEYAEGDISAVTCRRAPWADRYADKPLPVWLMVAHRWHFECSGCGRRIDEDSLIDAGLPLEGVMGTQYSHAFCGKNCARRFYSLQRRRKEQEARAIEAFKAIVRHRFPDVNFCDDVDSNKYREHHHAYVTPGRGGWHWRQVVVSFTFPGMKIAPAHYAMHGSYKIGPDPARYTCCNGDREAFEKYVAETRRSKTPT